MVLIVTNTATARNFDQVVFEGVRCAGVYLVLSAKGGGEDLNTFWSTEDTFLGLSFAAATIQADSLRVRLAQAHCNGDGGLAAGAGFGGGRCGGCHPAQGRAEGPTAQKTGERSEKQFRGAEGFCYRATNSMRSA